MWQDSGLSGEDKALIDLAEIRRAAERIGARIRHTPLVSATPCRDAPGPGRLSLKLECLQISGSFKARGALNTALSLPAGQSLQRLVTASGGNHGLGVAYAASVLEVPATIVLPRTTPQEKIDKLARWGAEIVLHGQVWDDANQEALARGEVEGAEYVHPFADPRVIAGQGTVALEILEDAPDLDLLIAPIGGGGLMAGLALAAHALKPTIRIVGVEPEGAATLHDSLQAGELVTLEQIATRANTLAPRRSEGLNFGIIRDRVERIVLVSDAEMEAAARWLWFEHGVAAELSAAAATAAVLSGKVPLSPDTHTCAVVTGAGSAGLA